MERTQLGEAGPSVSRLGLGTAYFGTRLEGKAARRIVDRFLEAGGNLIDTADVYGRAVRRPGVTDAGASERTLGELLLGRRQRVFLATKVGQRTAAGAGTDKVGLSRAAIERAVDSSLRRLRTDWIDLYQCHLSDPFTPVEETLGALADLVSSGKIRWVGVSNWDGWQVTSATLTAKVLGNSPIVSNQVWYNVIDRQIENSVVPACRQAGVGIIAWGALAQGFLVGGYQRADVRPAPGTRLDAGGQLRLFSWEALATPRGWDIVETVNAIAGDQRVAPSTVAMRWLLDAGAADVVLIGPRDEAQLEEFLLAGRPTVTRGAMERLTAVSEPEHSYPRCFTEAYALRDSPVYGGLPNLGYGGESEGST
jgi:aryl-alcohol dehydrogenase-like predicted oxidoreductase